MLVDLGLGGPLGTPERERGIRLLTNNPEKVRAVEGPGREVVVKERVGMVPLAWQSGGEKGVRGKEVEKYISTKVSALRYASRWLEIMVAVVVRLSKVLTYVLCCRLKSSSTCSLDPCNITMSGRFMRYKEKMLGWVYRSRFEHDDAFLHTRYDIEKGAVQVQYRYSTDTAKCASTREAAILPFKKLQGNPIREGVDERRARR